MPRFVEKIPNIIIPDISDDLIQIPEKIDGQNLYLGGITIIQDQLFNATIYQKLKIGVTPIGWLKADEAAKKIEINISSFSDTDTEILKSWIRIFFTQN